jgi:hypothetical protein
MLRNSPVKSVPGQFGDGPGQFHPGRAAADDDEGQQPLPLFGISAVFGLLEGQQQPTPDSGGVVNLLQARRVGFPVVAPEVAVTRAGRQHQIVVTDACRRSESPGARGRPRPLTSPSNTRTLC